MSKYRGRFNGKWRRKSTPEIAIYQGKDINVSVVLRQPKSTSSGLKQRNHPQHAAPPLTPRPAGLGPHFSKTYDL
jgi:hypothetical protein